MNFVYFAFKHDMIFKPLTKNRIDMPFETIPPVPHAVTVMKNPTTPQKNGSDP